MRKWINLLIDNYTFVILLGVIFLFFYPFFLQGKIPIPADTIVGMYHPWRDVVWDGYKAGVPFKNPLVTDPVRQQYVWRKLAIDQLLIGKMPTWNPYSFSGTPLLANFQSGTFYPLNVIFLFLPFHYAWASEVFLQMLLTGIFLYLYLRNLQISKFGSLLGSISFIFSGFVIAWLEWNTIIHTALWIPFLLLSIDKIIYYFNHKHKSINKVRNKKILLWSCAFTFSLISSFLAGHLQIFFYSLLITIIYIISKVILLNKNIYKTFLLFAICYFLFAIITGVQWLPTIQLIRLSARAIDQGLWHKEGWFIPWQHLVQFVVPDFFGNPATGNYWGVWNYAEFVGFIGIAPFIFALYALIYRNNNKVIFFGILIFVALLFALPTPLAKLPYQWGIPLLSTSQPTRLIFVADFALSILAAIGFDRFLKDKSLKRTVISVLPVGIILILLWVIVLNPTIFTIFFSENNNLVSKKNLILPSFLFVINIFILRTIIKTKNNFIKMITVSFLLLVVLFDLLRFSWKFTPFTNKDWIFPNTKLISKINDLKENWRVMSLDRRVFPPNFLGYYKIQDVGGYDPLYLSIFNQLVASWERNKPDITLASFNRIVTPTVYESFMTDLLGVKYIFSFGEATSQKLKLIDREGTTFLYENTSVFPRVFLAEKIINTKNSQEEIDTLFSQGNNLKTIAVTSESTYLPERYLSSNEKARIIYYGENYIKIEVTTDMDRLLILTDIYYPSWDVYVDGKIGKIIPTDFAFRGVIIPAGDHLVEYKDKLL